MGIEKQVLEEMAKLQKKYFEEFFKKVNKNKK